MSGIDLRQISSSGLAQMDVVQSECGRYVAYLNWCDAFALRHPFVISGYGYGLA